MGAGDRERGWNDRAGRVRYEDHVRRSRDRRRDVLVGGLEMTGPPATLSGVTQGPLLRVTVTSLLYVPAVTVGGTISASAAGSQATSNMPRAAGSPRMSSTGVP